MVMSYMVDLRRIILTNQVHLMQLVKLHQTTQHVLLVRTRGCTVRSHALTGTPQARRCTDQLQMPHKPRFAPPASRTAPAAPGNPTALLTLPAIPAAGP